ncbi:GAF sensor signal transduction histidine kinase [Reichenbachiella faecimaris]|uniref:histidine kinase n=1 Tax=Reichenbachiella faecimaris TaxID=692418 RepID=A0A1W2G7F7_REIFA|nr:GAF domain-containing sensor histidine kinase [Reichenbachiella faecimaris]SMD32619.1 GAF sensor signal transduction histidine kinase [Reichenbachiella faecimaris]
MTITKHKENKAKERMQQIFDLFTELSSDQSYQLDKVLKRATELVEMDIGIVSQIKNGFYEVKEVYSPEGVGIVKGQEFELSDTYCSLTFASSRLVDLNHIGISEHEGHPCYKNSKLEAYIGVPIMVNGAKYGTLNFSSPSPRKVYFNQFDRDFVLYLGQWLSQHITRLEYEKKLSKKNEQLRTLLDEREKFSAMLIHDLKSPLNNLSGLLDISKAMTDDRAIADMMKDSLNQAFGLIADLQQINQLDQGLVEFKPAPLNGVDIAKSALDQFAVSAQQKGIKMTLKTTEKSNNIESDRKLLCSTLNNLISNAIKFSEPNSNVELSVFQKNDQLHYRVKDEGPGISQEDQTKLFGRFQRLTPQPTANEHSSGLGLYIVMENCKILNGSIVVESELNEGTAFTVSVPLKVEKD